MRVEANCYKCGRDIVITMKPEHLGCTWLAFCYLCELEVLNDQKGMRELLLRQLTERFGDPGAGVLAKRL